MVKADDVPAGKRVNLQLGYSTRNHRRVAGVNAIHGQQARFREFTIMVDRTAILAPVDILNYEETVAINRNLFAEVVYE